MLVLLSLDSSSLFFNATATTDIYSYSHTLSLHDARPVSVEHEDAAKPRNADDHDIAIIITAIGGRAAGEPGVRCLRYDDYARAGAGIEYLPLFEQGDRKSGVQWKGMSVRVDLGGRGIRENNT